MVVIKKYLVYFSNIKVVPVGMTRGVKKIMQAKIPNLAKYGDISEYMNR
jgi:ribosome biogenesis protein SSF1/2